MEESGGIEPLGTGLSDAYACPLTSTGLDEDRGQFITCPRFSRAFGDRSPALSLEHPAAVETANTWVAITSLLHFAFGCTAWYPARDSNSERPDPKSGGFASFPSRAKSQNWKGRKDLNFRSLGSEPSALNRT
jgi:hypothetical protein